MTDTENSGHGGVDEYSDEMAAKLVALADDETLDMDARARQDEGWFRLYVECPACRTPMARTTTESDTVVASGPRYSRSKMRFHAVCPDCGAMESALTVYRETRPYNEKFRAADEEE